MALVKGKWTFKDVLTDADIYQDVNFSTDGKNWDGGNSWNGIAIGNTGAAPFRVVAFWWFYEEYSTEQAVYNLEEYDDGIIQIGWEDEAYKTVDFGETEQTVDDAFYAWLVENTLPKNIGIDITENGTTTLATAGKYCDKNIDVNVNVQSGDNHYDAFWDSFQNNGKRRDYRYGFSGIGWTDEIFKPKYDIISNSSTDMFGYARFVDFKACLAYNGVTFDVSASKTTNRLFGFCYDVISLPKIDLSSATANTGTFTDCYVLKTIDELVVSATTPYHNTNFRNCEELESLNVTGTIGQNNFDVHWSTKLSKASIESIINALSSTTSGLTVTISKTAKEAAFTDAEWATLIATKSNWTISLA